MKHKVTCRLCEASVAIEALPDGRFPIAPLNGWRYNSEDGWRCPEHFKPDWPTSPTPKSTRSDHQFDHQSS